MLLLAGLLLLPGWAAAQPTIAQRALSTWTSAHPDTGAAVWRLDPGRTPVVVAEHRPDTPQLPASVMKLVTSGGALLSLGPEFRFTTTVAIAGTGAGRDGVYRGPLYLTGAGDPVLATRGYAGAYLLGRGGRFGRLAAGVRAQGIRLVRGPIVADESILDGVRVGPSWRSYYSLYAPPLSGLSVNQNYQGDARTTYAADPPVNAAARLRQTLRDVGVRHLGRFRTGVRPASAITVGQATSPPLRVILRLMNTASDNFIAEMLRKDVGAYGGDAGTSAEGAAVTTRLLAARNITSPNDRIVDGSGLSRANRLTAGTLVRLLAAANAEPAWGAALVDSLATGGTGTLIRRFKDPAIRDRVHGKTGYIDGVSSLAGVVDSPNGVRYAFAFLMNDWDITGAKATQDRIVTLVASGRLDPPPAQTSGVTAPARAAPR